MRSQSTTLVVSGVRPAFRAFFTANAELHRVDDITPYPGDQVIDRAVRSMEYHANEIIALSAQTREEVRAKAQILRIMLSRHFGASKINLHPSHGEAHERLTLSLVNDLLQADPT